jgi:hypothetical protein
MLKQFIFTFLLIIQSLAIFAQEEEFSPETYIAKNIKALQVYRKGWDLSYPFIQLNSNEKIILKFDDLDSDFKHYQYVITHCNSDWTPSSLTEQEYLDGFNNNPIRTYSYSTNTTVSYVHYEVEFPNDDIKLKASGNYVVKVYDSDNDNQLVVTAQFYVTEQSVTANAEVRRSEDPENMYTKQAVFLEVKHNFANVAFPQRDFKIFISQNGDPARTISQLKPYFIEDGRLDYRFQEGILFYGGNEFRKLDLKSIRYQSIMVKDIVYFAPYYNFYLFADEFTSRKKYFYYEDLNGKFIVANDRGKTPDTDADYVQVHFSVPTEVPYDGNLWVYGQLTNWQTSDSTLMQYNYRDKQYQLTLMLKQGYYNYEYVYKPNNQSVLESVFPECSHWETENNYLIRIYYQSPSDRYERLVGFYTVNSLNKK